MPDIRHQKLARVLVNYSLRLKPGDKFVIRSSPQAEPLIREVYREALRCGALIETRLHIEDLAEILFKEGNDEQIQYISDFDRLRMETYDAELYIWCEQNTRNLGGVDPKKIAMRRAALGPLTKVYLERIGSKAMRWCGTLLPTAGYAQDAGMSLSDYEDFVYGAGLLDEDDPVAGWRKQHDEQQRVIDFLSQHDEIRIVAPGTDITYRVGGRTWINCSGEENFPDGEIFSGPIEDSVNGAVCFTYPAIYDGNEVEDVRLTFRDGKVIESSAARGADFLNAMLDTDPGARYLGEVAFGLNYGIKRFVRNTLFDEKIGGTMHMALGASLPESGGKNESGLHWDMVCDLHEGKVYADGQLCYEAGRFTI